MKEIEFSEEEREATNTYMSTPKGPGKEYGNEMERIKVRIKPDVAQLEYSIYEDALFINHMIVRESRKGIGTNVIGYLTGKAQSLNKSKIGGFIGGGNSTKLFLEKNGFSGAEYELWTSDEWEAWKLDSAPSLDEISDECKSYDRIRKQCVKDDWWEWGYSVWFLDYTSKVYKERRGRVPVFNRRSPLLNKIKRLL
jgi:hypothetical protein